MRKSHVGCTLFSDLTNRALLLHACRMMEHHSDHETSLWQVPYHRSLQRLHVIGPSSRPQERHRGHRPFQNATTFHHRSTQYIKISPSAGSGTLERVPAGLPPY
jgi:hypothetical protein